MFETTFSDSAAFERHIAPDVPVRVPDALRAFDWPELVARIAAASDLRRIVSDSPTSGGFASFHAGAADHANNKRGVNPDGLGAVKHVGGNAVDTNRVTDAGNRED